MKVMTIFGTRPEMIKLWSTFRRLDEAGFEHVMVHTGQNYTKELKEFFYEDLELRPPDYELGIDVSRYSLEVADVVVKCDELFEREAPDALIILGDTHSGLSVLPAANRGIKIFHMEAGLRAWDKRMPEQRNRILIDHISDYLLPFNQYHRENLIREGIHPSKIFVTGNPTFEVMRHYQEKIDQSDILERMELDAGEYFLVTAHRSENVDPPGGLQKILNALAAVHSHFGKPVLYPMHPRTRIKLAGAAPPEGVKITEPFGFYDYNRLTRDSLCLISDSGTTPEESLFYRVPCVSLRKSTERPETVEAGAHIVAGLNPDDVLGAVKQAVSSPWAGRYDLEEDTSPASVVANVLRSRITNFF